MYLRLRLNPYTLQEIQVPSIYCIGLNYPQHAQEMHSHPPKEPIVFLKPAASLLPDGGEIHPPAFAQEVHHEVEIVVALAETCHHVSPQEATQYILGYGIGLDMTLRDIQNQAKAKGQPWAVAKGFASSAPLSELIPVDHMPDPDSLQFSLKVNGELRQKGCARDMLFSIPQLIAYLSQIFILQRGDLIYTGTPAGVGPVRTGDVLEAELLGYTRLCVRMGAPFNPN